MLKLGNRFWYELHTTLPTEQCDIATTVAGCIWHPAPLERKKEMSYHASTLIDSLTEKRNDAQEKHEELEEGKDAIQEAMYELESYIEDMNNLIDQLDTMPTVEIGISVDVEFSAE